MLKKILLVAAFVVVTVGLGLLLYRLFFAPSAPVVVIPPEGETAIDPTTGLPVSQPGRPVGSGVEGPGTLPAAGASAVAQGGVTRVENVVPSSSRIDAAAVTGGALSYYDQGDGKFYRRDAVGRIAELSERAFPGAESIEWSPKGDKALVAFPDDSKIVYDFASRRQTTLPRHWEDPKFTPDGANIIAKSMALDPENRWLISAASDGSSARLIEPLGENGDKVTVSVSPDASVVAFSDTGEPVGFDTRDLLLIGQNDENFKALRVDGFGFTPVWAPSGDGLIYSAAAGANDYKPLLWFVRGGPETVGQARTNLGLQTWADKCVFSGTEAAYCAVPTRLPSGAGLQREIADGIPDRIFRVDLRNGGTTFIGTPEEDMTVRRLLVSGDGSSLFLTGIDGTLREMRLR